MTDLLNVLLIEDSDADARLTLRELERAGHVVEACRVQDGTALRQAIQTRRWDVVICDHHLPTFDSSQAIAIVRGIDPDIGIIIVSGHIGERAAVRAMQFGADDYVLKDHLHGLPGAVQRTRQLEGERRKRRGLALALESRTAFLRALMETAPIGIVGLDLGGHITVANPAAEVLCGAREGMVGRRAAEVIDSADLPGNFAEFAETLTRSGPWTTEWRRAHSDGGESQIEITWSQVLQEGEVTAVTAILRDVTAHRRAEEEQRRMQRAITAAASDWTATFDAVPFPLLIVSEAGLIRRLNRAARDLFASDWDQVIGLAITRFEHFPWPPVTFHVRETIATLRSVVRTIHDQSGDRTWTFVSAPLQNDEGVHAVVLLRDISDFVQLERGIAQERTMGALGTLVAGVAHEVRNPLFAISATLDAFEARFGKEPEFTRYTSNLRPEVQRLSALMRDLLEYGRPPVLQPVLSDLTPVVREAVARSEQDGAARGVRVEIIAPEPPPQVRHDPGRLGQVVQNLLDNAVAHAPDESLVAVRMDTIQADGGSWLRIAVEDEGSGFRTDDLPHVFEPFYSRRRGGTGLGLSIVERLVGQHGGRVTAENRAEGGARVTILLPLA